MSMQAELSGLGAMPAAVSVVLLDPAAASDLLRALGEGSAAPAAVLPPAHAWLCRLLALHPLSPSWRQCPSSPDPEDHVVSLALEGDPRKQNKFPKYQVCAVICAYCLILRVICKCGGNWPGVLSTLCPEGRLQRHRVGTSGPS